MRTFTSIPPTAPSSAARPPGGCIGSRAARRSTSAPGASSAGLSTTSTWISGRSTTPPTLMRIYELPRWMGRGSRRSRRANIGASAKACGRRYRPLTQQWQWTNTGWGSSGSPPRPPLPQSRAVPSQFRPLRAPGERSATTARGQNIAADGTGAGRAITAEGDALGDGISGTSSGLAGTAGAAGRRGRSRRPGRSPLSRLPAGTGGWLGG